MIQLIFCIYAITTFFFMIYQESKIIRLQEENERLKGPTCLKLSASMLQEIFHDDAPRRLQALDSMTFINGDKNVRTWRSDGYF